MSTYDSLMKCKKETMFNRDHGTLSVLKSMVREVSAAFRLQEVKMVLDCLPSERSYARQFNHVEHEFYKVSGEARDNMVFTHAISLLHRIGAVEYSRIDDGRKEFIHLKMGKDAALFLAALHLGFEQTVWEPMELNIFLEEIGFAVVDPYDTVGRLTKYLDIKSVECGIRISLKEIVG